MQCICLNKGRVKFLAEGRFTLIVVRGFRARAVVDELKDYNGIRVHEFLITFDSEFSVFIFKFHCNLPPKNRTIWYSFSYYSTIFQIALIIVDIRVCKDNS